MLLSGDFGKNHRETGEKLYGSVVLVQCMAEFISKSVMKFLKISYSSSEVTLIRIRIKN